MGMTPLIDSRQGTSPRTLRRLGIATLVANIVIVVTGGAVRLTGSGLGCPAWPRCTDESFVAHGALGVHGIIEFGNRVFTLALAAIAVATWVAAMRSVPPRRSVRGVATALALGVPAQALLGGVTVLTDLNPWVVAGHLLLSLAMIGLSVVFLRLITEPDGPELLTVPVPLEWLVRSTFIAAWLVFYAGTVVTGSGPHAGDADAPRTGLDPAAVSQLHAELVFLLIGLTIGCNLGLRAMRGPVAAIAAATWLLAVEVAQGTIGLVQYASNLPVALVGLHLLGAALVSACATWLLVSVRVRS
jgi:cytochrome c oxidase assembly protein subunit 15